MAVLAPDRWTDHVAMVLTDGREAGTPIPGEWAQRVAQIGGVPLRERTRTPQPSRPRATGRGPSTHDRAERLPADLRRLRDGGDT